MFAYILVSILLPPVNLKGSSIGLVVGQAINIWWPFNKIGRTCNWCDCDLTCWKKTKTFVSHRMRNLKFLLAWMKWLNCGFKSNHIFLFYECGIFYWFGHRLSLGSAFTPQQYPELSFQTSNCTTSTLFDDDATDVIARNFTTTNPQFGPKNDFEDIYRLSYNLYPIIG